jgi:hypothetical protein
MHRPHLMGVAFAVLAACGGEKTSSTGSHSGSPTDDSTPGPTTTTTTPTTTTPTTPTDTQTDPTGLPPGLNGQPPSAPVGLPSFGQVTNRLGASVSPADLVGHPTVLWFYPAAGTGG